MEHLYTIPSITIVKERSGLNDVAVSLTVNIRTHETFEHTFDRIEYHYNDTNISKTVSFTENKTVENYQEVEIDLDTSNIDSSKFVEWDDLTEEEVIGWAKSAKDFSSMESEGASIVAEKKDRILNPNKYKFDSPTTPWVVRAIKEAAEAAKAEENK